MQFTHNASKLKNNSLEFKESGALKLIENNIWAQQKNMEVISKVHFHYLRSIQ